jgi:hypothetical protein
VLAGYAPSGDTAFHLQRLRPALVLVGVLTVLHMLQGRGVGQEVTVWPPGIGDRSRPGPGPSASYAVPTLECSPDSHPLPLPQGKMAVTALAHPLIGGLDFYGV